jgi:hypothetical protein
MRLNHFWKRRTSQQRFLNRETLRTIEDFRTAKAMIKRKTGELKNRWWTEKARIYGRQK